MEEPCLYHLVLVQVEQMPTDHILEVRSVVEEVRHRPLLMWTSLEVACQDMHRSLLWRRRKGHMTMVDRIEDMPNRPLHLGVERLCPLLLLLEEERATRTAFMRNRHTIGIGKNGSDEKGNERLEEALDHRHLCLIVAPLLGIVTETGSESESESMQEDRVNIRTCLEVQDTVPQEGDTMIDLHLPMDIRLMHTLDNLLHLEMRSAVLLHLLIRPSRRRAVPRGNIGPYPRKGMDRAIRSERERGALVVSRMSMREGRMAKVPRLNEWSMRVSRVRPLIQARTKDGTCPVFCWHHLKLTLGDPWLTLGCRRLRRRRPRRTHGPTWGSSTSTPAHFPNRQNILHLTDPRRPNRLQTTCSELSSDLTVQRHEKGQR